MAAMTRQFTPTRAAALERLNAFIPHMGRAYAEGRNTDPGPDGEPLVSMLSPYVRHRLLLEEELVGAALRAHGLEAARSFIDEVMWRTYWKGWLEQRPAIWHRYRAGVRRDQDRLATEGGLRRVFQDATEGRTGIDCFDAWARELVETNWLHNHARMWFASIWIFTLRLPWTLGADFFLRHLLDGDAASNTLSWRWVAGLHTRGKCYVARAANIARFTNGRFDPAGQLDEAPDPLVETEALPPPRLPAADAAPSVRFVLVVHDEVWRPETLGFADDKMVRIGRASARSGIASHGAAGPVASFAAAAVDDAMSRLGRPVDALAPHDVAEWVRQQAHEVVVAYAPVGPTSEMLAGLPVRRVRRPWDDLSWPHATAGFFGMRTRIPAILAALDDGIDARRL
jgi:deoxyribodipyrimidine photo-lyase